MTSFGKLGKEVRRSNKKVRQAVKNLNPLRHVERSADRASKKILKNVNDHINQAVDKASQRFLSNVDDKLKSDDFKQIVQEISKEAGKGLTAGVLAEVGLKKN